MTDTTNLNITADQLGALFEAYTGIMAASLCAALGDQVKCGNLTAETAQAIFEATGEALAASMEGVKAKLAQTDAQGSEAQRHIVMPAETGQLGATLG